MLKKPESKKGSNNGSQKGSQKGVVGREGPFVFLKDPISIGIIAKKPRNFCLIGAFLGLFHSPWSWSQGDLPPVPPRVSVQTYQQGSIMPIFLTPGRSSVIDFPCPVTKASGGTGGDLHTILATSLGNEVDLSLDSSVSQPTSLIVRCKEQVFVFDIIPSKNTHQEYVKIKESLGMIKFHQNTSTKVKSSSEATPKDRKGVSSGVIPNSKPSYKMKKIDSGQILPQTNKQGILIKSSFEFIRNSSSLQWAFSVLFLSSPVFAQIPDNPRVLERVPEGKARLFVDEETTQASKESKASKESTVSKEVIKDLLSHKKKLLIAVALGDGNLPRYARTTDLMQRHQNPIVLPQKTGIGEGIPGLNVGDLLKCRISQSFKAYHNSQIPIRALVTEGAMKGSVLLGEASMDPKSRTVRILFTSLRTKANHLYSFSGGVYSKNPDELAGEYKTHYWEYFWSEALLSATAGYTQSTVERSRNVFGHYEMEPTPENAAKTGVASGLSTAVREMSERVKTAPEYIMIEGPLFVEVMVLKEAVKF